MKKTLTINLGGFVFNIDEDACDQLSQYLADIEKRFPEEERTEIIRDIEERMAELLTYKLQNRNVVETNDVEEVIEVIGKPEQFEDESGEGQTETSASTDKSAFADKSASANGGKTPERKSRRTRKLYRNSNDRMVSGVASGLAAYFDLDPAIMRILFVILAFASLGWGILIYLILLIAMPEAKTKAQFLEMQGIEPTLENIDNFQMEPVAHSDGATTFGKILKICLIVLGIIIGACLALCVLGIFIAIFVALLTHEPDSFGNAIDMGLLGSCALFLLCPVIGIAILCVRAAGGERKHKGTGWILLAVWLLSLFGIIGFGIEAGKHDNIGKRLERTGEQWERWFENNDFVTTDSYFGTTELDSIIDPVLDGLRDDNTTYDITIHTSPEKGVNLHISSNKNAEQDVNPSDSI
ncbi:MAG: PspC domain-containing protein [Bacteroidales bacterium]|nr:PspC domain-containing protein [Bacteroidales bacterium]